MRELRMICAAMAALLMVGTRASMQTRGTAAVWQGWMQCKVTIQADGFMNRQTHTWTITGPPVMVGAIADYPATWTVAGEGAQRGATPDQASGQWTTNGSMPSARIGILVRASDNRLVALLRSSQQSVPGATSGMQQVAGPASLAVSAPGTYQIAITLPMPQTSTETQNQSSTATTNATTQTRANVSTTTTTTVGYVIVAGEVIFTATTYYPLSQQVTLQKQDATVVLPASSSSPLPATATFQFSVAGTHSVRVVGSVVVERHDVTRRTVTTTTTTHDSACNCSDKTSTSTNYQPDQTQVSSKTLYMIGAPPDAFATLQVSVR